MLEEYQDDYRKWQSLYRKFTQGNGAIKIQNLYNLKGIVVDPALDAATGDGTVGENYGKKILKKFVKGYDTLGDIFDFVRDGHSLFGVTI